MRGIQHTNLIYFMNELLRTIVMHSMTPEAKSTERIFYLMNEKMN